MTDQQAIKELKAELKRIADKNDDEWRTTVTVNEKGCYIEVIETADRHTLTDGRGASVSEAIANLKANLPAALESWGYTA
jgi:hypothetical protein